MSRAIFFSLGFFMMVSCKRDYVCHCEWYEYVNGSIQHFNSESVVKATSKTKAQKTCSENEKLYFLEMNVNCEIQ